MEQFTKHVEGQFKKQKATATLSDYQLSTLWTLLPAMHRRLGAPLGGKAADCFVDILAETEKIADDAPIQEGAIGVGVREVGGLKHLVSKLIEDSLSYIYLLLAESSGVQYAKRLKSTDADTSSASDLPIGVPPKTQQSKSAVSPYYKCVFHLFVIKCYVWPSPPSNTGLLSESNC